MGVETMTDEPMTDEPMTNEAAAAILADDAHRLATVWRALDGDGDDVLSAAEIANASASLLALDTNGDGQLTVEEIGGPFRWPGGERRSAIVRILDLDADGIITAADIADAPDRLRRLDRLGEGRLLPRHDRPAGNPILTQAHDGPAETLAHFDILRRYQDEPNGPVMPGDHPGQDQGYLLIQEHCNAGDVQVGRDCFLQAPDGTRVHHWPPHLHASETVTAHLREDGLLIRTACPGPWLDVLCFPVGAHGVISMAEPDGTVVWEYRLFEPGRRVLHHDFEPMPNGNILVTVYEGRTFDEAVAIGWQDQARDVLMRPPDLQRWWTETVLELEPNLETGETRVVWEWRSADHLVQDVDPAKPNHGQLGPGCRRIDLNYARYPRYRFNMGQIMHVNTLSYHAGLDQIMLSSAMHGELWVIDHSTTTDEARGSTGGRQGSGGDLLYRWGNRSAYKCGPESDKILDWQHDTHWIPDDVPHTGDVLVFNNGSRRPGDDSPNPDPRRLSFLHGAYSEILEVKLPVDVGGAWTWDLDDRLNGAEIVWDYNADGGDGWFSPFMSGARRRPNGNTVSALGYNKRIREVTPAGETVLDFLPGGPGRTFRVVPIAADHPGLPRLGLWR
ncbi:MAG: aryl-sulfate sulfotransferase [Acidimicrobiales bacterium]